VQVVDRFSYRGADMDSNIATQFAADEEVVRAIHQGMIDAWNAGDAAAFAAPCTDDADFVAFEGTRLKGRREITSFHQQYSARS
jgi:uncharacterized protein (TIGR02246 family)